MPVGPWSRAGRAVADCTGAERCARYCITILALSVFPAPDSPLIRIACRCSSIIMALKACNTSISGQWGVSASDGAELLIDAT